MNSRGLDGLVNRCMGDYMLSDGLQAVREPSSWLLWDRGQETLPPGSPKAIPCIMSLPCPGVVVRVAPSILEECV